MHKPKINKLKGGYPAIANLIFHFWLKDMKSHMEDWNLNKIEAIQLIKDFTTKYISDKVEFYMGMVLKGQQTFGGIIDHLKCAFQYQKDHK